MDQITPSLRTIFNEAAEIDDRSARARFLDAACKTDPTLRARVERLLEADSSAGTFLNGPPGATASELLSEKVGERLGRYRLLERLGEGGFGVVYMAEQEEPVRRRVALKVIKVGMDTRAFVARFEAERQTLALMDHPNIAKVFDAGATESGRPFFVMELVRGVPVTAYCEQKQLSVRQRLELFLPICQAVQHAHQKGIIHRDLKPSNILIVEQDGTAVPKVIDFGIAKATGQALQDNPIVTGVNQLVGTPAYMSPEQAGLGGRDIDTRSDIFSLGVILYEMLTGQPPFDAAELSRLSLEEVRRIIREDDPPSPSQRLTDTCDAAAPAAARARWRERLASVRGDLDWIVMKCLEKDRTRRYETTNGLAMDIRRHLDHETVVARPPSAAYRFQKVFRRNRLAFTAAAVIGLVMVAAVVISGRLALRATRAEHEQSALRGVAESRAEENRRQLVRLNVVTGNAVQEGDLFGALLWYTEALRLDEGDPVRQKLQRRRIAAIRKQTPELERMWFHESLVEKVSFSPEGTQVLSTSLDWTARLWDVGADPAIASLKHASNIYQSYFTPDGRHAVTVSAAQLIFWDRAKGTTCFVVPAPSWEADFRPDGALVAIPDDNDNQVKLFDAHSGNPLPRVFAHPGWPRFVRFTGDGNRLVSVTETNVFIWNSAQAQLLTNWPAHSKRISHLSVSADGKTIVTVASTLSGSEIRRWSSDGNELLPALPQHDGYVYQPDISPDGQRLLTYGYQSPARVWDIRTGKQVGGSMRPRGGVAQAFFSPDGGSVATASWDTTARVWDARTGEPASPLLRHGGFVRSIASSPDGERLVTAGQEGAVRLWHFRPSSLHRLRLQHAKGVVRAVWSRSGDRILTCSHDGIARLWDARTGEKMNELRYPAHIYVADFCLDGKTVLTVSSDSAIRFWDSTTGREVTSSFKAPMPWRMQVRSDGEQFLWSDNRTAMIFSCRTGQPILPPFQHTNQLRAVQFSPDGKYVVTAAGTVVRMWDAQTGQPIRAPMVHDCDVYSARFSADSRRLVTACSDNTQLPRYAQVWDAQTGLPAGPRLPHLDGVLTADFSPDGKRVVTGGEDNVAMIWDSESGKRVSAPLRHTSFVSTVKFSPDNQMILTVSRDRTARVWETATGEPVIPPINLLDAETHQMSSVAWSPDGNEFLAPCEDQTVRVWNLSPATESIEELQRQAEVLAAHRLEPNIGMVPLTVPELKARWESRTGAKK